MSIWVELLHAETPEWREKAKELRKHRSVIEDLQRGAKCLAVRSAELERLIDAAKPLYDSLDDAKRSSRTLLRITTGKHWYRGLEGLHHG